MIWSHLGNAQLSGENHFPKESGARAAKGCFLRRRGGAQKQSVFLAGEFAFFPSNAQSCWNDAA